MRANRTLLAYSLVIVALIGIGVAATWPLARHLPRAVPFVGDPFINAWILSWTADAVATGRSVWNAPIFYPHELTLTFSENLFGIGILAWPLALSFDALTTHNILLLASFPLTGIAMLCLARALGASVAGASVAALAIMLQPWRFTHLTHLQHLWMVWLVLLLWSTVRFAQSPSVSRTFLLGVLFVLNGLANLHYLAFSVLVVPLTLLCLAPEDRRFWKRAAVAIGVASTVLVILLIPYYQATKQYAFRTDLNETAAYSARLNDWMVAGLAPEWYRTWIINVEVNPERWLFPGVVPLVLAIVAVVPSRAIRRPEGVIVDTSPRSFHRVLDVLILCCAVVGWYLSVHGAKTPLGPRSGSIVFLVGTLLLLGRLAAGNATWPCYSLLPLFQRTRHSPEQWTCLMWIIIGVFGSLGVNGFLHEGLMQLGPLFAGIRAPARWAVIAYMGIAVLAGLGVERIGRHLPWRKLVIGVFAIVLMLEFWPSVRYRLVAETTADVYTWLAECRDVRIVELPITKEQEYQYLLFETLHQQPSVNGVSGLEPPVHQEIRGLWEQSPISDSLTTRLRELRVSHLVVHVDAIGARAKDVEDWLTRELEVGSVRTVGRWPRHMRGDWVFALKDQLFECPPPRVVPTETTPAAIFALETARQQDCTTGWMGSPAEGASVNGDLEVSGWAVSPAGIAEIQVKLNGHQRTYHPERFDDPYIASLFRGKHERPTFRITIQRPSDHPVDTDVQVIIVDKQGKQTALPQVWFRWEK